MMEALRFTIMRVCHAYGVQSVSHDAVGETQDTPGG